MMGMVQEMWNSTKDGDVSEDGDGPRGGMGIVQEIGNGEWSSELGDGSGETDGPGDGPGDRVGTEKVYRMRMLQGMRDALVMENDTKDGDDPRNGEWSNYTI